MGMKSVNEVLNDKSMKIPLRNFNEINDDSTGTKKRNPRITYTDYLADKLVEIYHAPQSRNFFLKCAWNLSEDTIWSAVEDSRKKCVSSPIALFIFICNNALRERSVKS